MMVFIFFPLTGALLGWLFFYLFSKIFWIPDSSRSFTFSRIFEQLKGTTGGLLQEKLFGNDFLTSQLNCWIDQEKTIGSLQPSIEKVVHQFVDHTMMQRWPMIGMFLNGDAKEKMKAGLIEEILKAAPGVLKNAGESLIGRLENDQLLDDLLAKFTITEGRKILEPALRPVFRKLSLAGLFLGLLIGLVLSLMTLIFC